MVLCALLRDQPLTRNEAKGLHRYRNALIVLVTEDSYPTVDDSFLPEQTMIPDQRTLVDNGSSPVCEETAAIMNIKNYEPTLLVCSSAPSYL